MAGWRCCRTDRSRRRLKRQPRGGTPPGVRPWTQRPISLSGVPGDCSGRGTGPPPGASLPQPRPQSARGARKHSRIQLRTGLNAGAPASDFERFEAIRLEPELATDSLGFQMVWRDFLERYIPSHPNSSQHIPTHLNSSQLISSHLLAWKVGIHWVSVKVGLSHWMLEDDISENL